MLGSGIARSVFPLGSHLSLVFFVPARTDPPRLDVQHHSLADSGVYLWLAPSVDNIPFPNLPVGRDQQFLDDLLLANNHLRQLLGDLVPCIFQLGNCRRVNFVVVTFVGHARSFKRDDENRFPQFFRMFAHPLQRDGH